MDKEFIVTLSEETLKRIKKGEIILSSGGARDANTKQMVELFKMTDTRQAKNLLDLAPGAQTVIGMVNTAQMCYMQKGINEINKKTDMILKTTNLLKKMSILNTFISLANLGISVVGFASLHDRLTSSVSASLRTCDMMEIIIKNHMQKERYQMISDYGKYSNMMTYYFDKLQNLDSIENGEHDHITEEITECNEFLKRLENESCFAYLSGVEWCKMIISFSTAYAQLVGTYVAEYRRTKGREHVCQNSWLSSIQELKSDTLKSKIMDELRKYYIFEFPALSPEELSLAFDISKQIPYMIEEKFIENYCLGLKYNVEERELIIQDANYRIQQKVNNPQMENGVIIID